MKNIIDYLNSEKTKTQIVNLICANILLYKGIDTYEKIQKFSGSLYNAFVLECVQNNQYISLTNKTINAINGIYKELIIKLQLISDNENVRLYIDEIVNVHRNKLVNAITNNNSENSIEQLFIPCAEYTGEFQNEILRLDSNQLLDPILDIGCGNKYELVKLLRRNGYKYVYGLDQYVSLDEKIICSNWFDFKFLENTWGCIIAHMSFTNHFRRVVINNERTIRKFENKYNEILRSLKINGMFVYTPSVKSIEDKVDNGKYTISYYRNLSDKNLDTVHIQRRF